MNETINPLDGLTGEELKTKRAELAKTKALTLAKILESYRVEFTPTKVVAPKNLNFEQTDKLFDSLGGEQETKWIELRSNKTVKRVSIIDQNQTFFDSISSQFDNVKLDDNLFGKADLIGVSYHAWYRSMYPKVNVRKIWTKDNIEFSNIVEYCFSNNLTIPTPDSVKGLKTKIVDMNESAIEEIHGLIA